MTIITIIRAMKIRGTLKKCDWFNCGNCVFSGKHTCTSAASRDLMDKVRESNEF